MLGNIFGTKNPANAAMPYLNQIPGTISPLYQPFINAGQWALPQMESQYGSLINNPGGVMNKIGAGYQQSPGYQFNVNQATQAANSAAAAGGMAGSPAEQAALAQQVSGYANQDYNQYLQSALGMYGQGMQGLSGLYQTGYGASTGLAGDLASNLMNQANLAYSGRANQNQMTGGLWGNLAGLGSSWLLGKK
jgi:hypothetical protein